MPEAVAVAAGRHLVRDPLLYHFVKRPFDRVKRPFDRVIRVAMAASSSEADLA